MEIITLKTRHWYNSSEEHARTVIQVYAFTGSRRRLGKSIYIPSPNIHFSPDPVPVTFTRFNRLPSSSLTFLSSLPSPDRRRSRIPARVRSVAAGFRLAPPPQGKRLAVGAVNHLTNSIILKIFTFITTRYHPLVIRHRGLV